MKKVILGLMVLVSVVSADFSGDVSIVKDSFTSGEAWKKCNIKEKCIGSLLLLGKADKEAVDDLKRGDFLSIDIIRFVARTEITLDVCKPAGMISKGKYDEVRKNMEYIREVNK